ncbi:MAG: TetR/AcrR family transcriptional regulator [Actinomycetales bacterium]|nr:TetR/AcrR family transcriptional regulator [Actinomycetales bacterium]
MTPRSAPTATPKAGDPAPRMRAEDRRELVLRAATRVFGERGYHGATTDAIAKAAGVSQPYVVRMFDGKEALFLEVLGRALERVSASFRQAIAELPPGASPLDRAHCIGAAYGELLSDRGLLLSLMHAFVAGADPEIGAAARSGFLQIYRLLRDEAGLSPDEVTGFLAEGMLLNTLVGLRMGLEVDDDPAAAELVQHVAPTKHALLVQLAKARTV